MDSRAGLFVQSGLLADPVVDMPVQCTVVVQESLRLQNEECMKECRERGGSYSA